MPPPSNPTISTITSVPKNQNQSPFGMHTSHSTSKDHISQTTAAAAPTDFAEDPFKDYRYEDPFNIKDPFGEDDDGEKSSDGK